MPNAPIILIEGEGEWGWIGHSNCPRRDVVGQGVQSLFCPVKDRCIFPDIFTRADTQKNAREKMAKVTLPTCLDKKRFVFLVQPPQPAHTVPGQEEADYVIKSD